MAAFDMGRATPAQREVIEEIHKDRGIPAGQPVSPLWASMLASPGATRRIAGLGAHCRFGSALGELHREVVILAAVHPLQFEAEIRVHTDIAAKLGLGGDALSALQASRFDALPAELRALAELSFAVATGSGKTAAPLAAVRSQSGEQAAVDAVATAGYYVMLFRVSQALKS